MNTQRQNELPFFGSAVPSLGVKIDACPGRLNQTSVFLKRPGIFYGQCSEICGVNHGFMPIVVLGLDLLATYSQFGGLDILIREFGIMEHFSSIQKGVLDTSDILYFISATLIFILATKLSLESRKW